MRKLVISAMLLLVLTSGLMAITVEGNVVDAETGATIEGATVRFVIVNTEVPGLRGNGNGNGNGSGNGPGYGNPSHVFSTVTDANGHYILEDLPEGLFNVIARKTGAYPSVRIEGVEFTGDSVYDIELIPGNCEPPSPVGGFRLRSKK